MATNHAPDIEKEIRQALGRLEAVRDRRLPVAVGTEAVEYVRGNFRAGGIDGRRSRSAAPSPSTGRRDATAPCSAERTP